MQPPASRPLPPPLTIRLLATVLVVGSGAVAWAQDTPYLVRPSAGKVIGYVLHAATREPVGGARVVVAERGTFADTGPTVATTDDRGRYEARAALGRQKSSFKFHLFTPSEKREEKTIQVTQLDLRVEKEGYQPFLGPVAVCVASVPRFSVYMCEIRLAPAGSELSSFSTDNDRWEYLQEFVAEPAIGRPGEKVTVHATLRLPPERGIRYEVSICGPEGVLGAPPLRLPAARVQANAEHMRYERTFTISKKRKHEAGVFRLDLVRLMGGTRDELDAPEAKGVLVQAVQDDDQAAAAALCQEAYDLRAKGELAAAADTARHATERAEDYGYAWELYGDLLVALSRPDEAADSYRHMEAVAADVEEGLPKLAVALAAAGKAQEGLDLLRAKDTDRTDIRAATNTEMSTAFNVAMVRCYLALGDLEAADQRLMRAPDADRELLSQVALERAQAQLRAQDEASPDVDVHLALGRALADRGRWQEAATAFQRAARLAPKDAWTHLDLAQAFGGGLGRHEEALIEAQTAVRLGPQNGQAVLALARAYQDLGREPEALAQYQRYAELRPEDFYGQHWRGLGLLTEGKIPEAVAALQEALKLARAKGQTSEKPGFMPIGSGQWRIKTFVWGYRYDEANWDYVILDSLETLRTKPDNLLATYDIGRALVHLGLGASALPLLQRYADAHDDPEISYYIARAHLNLGEDLQARGILEQVIRRNPQQPHARLDLAQLLLTQGDLLGAQRQLALHRQNYPEEAAEPLPP